MLLTNSMGLPVPSNAHEIVFAFREEGWDARQVDAVISGPRPEQAGTPFQGYTADLVNENGELIETTGFDRLSHLLETLLLSGITVVSLDLSCLIY